MKNFFTLAAAAVLSMAPFFASAQKGAVDGVMTVTEIALPSPGNTYGFIRGTTGGKAVQTKTDSREWFESGGPKSFSLPKGTKVVMTMKNGKPVLHISEGSVSFVFSDSFKREIKIGMNLKYKRSGKFAVIINDGL
ncbi:MAG: hypothetical protein LBK07_03905 [Tannerella sp.]|jgi:hypothetical protein|nr:hypothetical protein [Tannerella sp.]